MLPSMLHRRTEVVPTSVHPRSWPRCRALRWVSSHHEKPPGCSG